MMLVIGVTGKNCAGKDSVADILVSEGFERHSLSDAIREELQRRKRPITRESLIEVGNELRRESGPRALADLIKRRLSGKNAVIVSIRNPSEITSLRELPAFTLIGVDAPAALRYARERAREREDGIGSFEEFLATEAAENSTNPANQQLDECFKLADEVIINDSTTEELRKEVLALLEKLEVQT
jgi:dCMP deaminase